MLCTLKGRYCAHRCEDKTFRMAEEFKKQGNDAFSAGKFDEAIEFFSQAIELDPSNHVL